MYKSKMRFWILLVVVWLVVSNMSTFAGQIKTWLDDMEKWSEEDKKNYTPEDVGIFCEVGIRDRMDATILQSDVAFSDANRDIIIERSGTRKSMDGYSKVNYYSPLVCIAESEHWDSLFENQDKNGFRTIRAVSLKKLLIGLEKEESYKDALNTSNGSMCKKEVALVIDSEFIDEIKMLFTYALYPEYKEKIENGLPLPEDVTKRVENIIKKCETTDNVFDFYSNSDNEYKVIIAPEYKWDKNDRYPVYIFDTIAIDYDVWYRSDIANLDKVVNEKAFMEVTGFRKDGFSSSYKKHMKYSCWTISCIRLKESEDGSAVHDSP